MFRWDNYTCTSGKEGGDRIDRNGWGGERINKYTYRTLLKMGIT